jgi:hypothetical protein
VGEDIFGPFEAGFSSMQDFVLQRLGCEQGEGYVAGGIDTHTAERMMAQQCGITLPRVKDDGPRGYISLLDESGGHTYEYHFHESMACLYKDAGARHSPQIGQGNNGAPLYGMWEHKDKGILPSLDACGGHYGRTPESPDKDVYHYHVQASPPFTFGCYGPNDDKSLVTVQQCRSFYAGCDGNLQTLHTPEGDIQYDDWCPCFDAQGSNSGVNITEFPVFSQPKSTLLAQLPPKLRVAGANGPQRSTSSSSALALVATLVVSASVLLVVLRRSQPAGAGVSSLGAE